MKEVKNILCPLDFSEHSQKACDLAFQLARAYGSSVTLVYVFPRFNYYDLGMPGMYYPIPMEDVNALIAESKNKLEAAAQDLKTKHPDIAIATRFDDLSEADDGILSAAENVKADLIVIGSHGRKGLNRLLMGSVAESVLRHAKCDVIILKSS